MGPIHIGPLHLSARRLQPFLLLSETLLATPPDNVVDLTVSSERKFMSHAEMDNNFIVFSHQVCDTALH